MLAVAIAAAGAAPARASNIMVSVDGGGYQPLQSAPFDLHEDITLQTGAGHTAGAVDPTGYSLAKVAELQQLAGANLQSATVFNPSGEPSQTFSHSDISDGSTPDGGAPEYPVIAPFQGTGWQLYWPIRTPDEDNSQPVQTSTAGTGADANLYVELSTQGRTIAVPAIQATPAHPDAGQIVSFSLSRPVAGAQSYAWDFGDGTGASGATPVHAFAAGTYPVKVTVTSPGGSGVSPPFTLVAGSPPPSATGTPSAGGTGSGSSLPTGPVKGGHAPASAPTPGAKPGRTKHARSGHAGSRPRAPATASAAPTATAGPPRAAATPRPAATPVPPSGGTATATPAPPVGRPAPKQATGLTGLLVSAAPAAALSRPQTAAERFAQQLAAARRAAASAPHDTPVGVVDGALGAGAVIMLLALGALRELDPRARYRKLAT